MNKKKIFNWIDIIAFFIFMGFMFFMIRIAKADQPKKNSLVSLQKKANQILLSRAGHTKPPLRKCPIYTKGGLSWVGKLATAIYYAEGGNKTSYPYGILAHYKHITPRQACINTINHALRDWNGKGDFIIVLGSRYCPVSAHRLNRYWVRNVRYYLKI